MRVNQRSIFLFKVLFKSCLSLSWIVVAKDEFLETIYILLQYRKFNS